VSPDTSRKLLEAAAAGDAEAVLAALEAGAAVNTRGEFGDTALNIAAEKGHAGVVAVLLGAGADIENLGGADKTPLMNAAFAGNTGIVRHLLERGARVSDDLLSSLQVKVSILEENAEGGMVRPEAAEAWRGFLDAMIAERRKQDGAAAP
jgi:ankyrin repeat protein